MIGSIFHFKAFRICLLPVIFQKAKSRFRTILVWIYKMIKQHHWFNYILCPKLNLEFLNWLLSLNFKISKDSNFVKYINYRFNGNIKYRMFPTHTTVGNLGKFFLERNTITPDNLCTIKIKITTFMYMNSLLYCLY